MTGRLVSLAVAIGVIVAAGVWWRGQTDPSASAPARAERDSVDGLAPGAETGDDGAVRPTATFRDRLRSFLANAERMNPDERRSHAAQLRDDVLAREGRGDLLPAESAYLQLALLRATVTDPQALQERSQALLESYQSSSDDGWQAYRNQPDARHRAYRVAEAALVREAAQGPDRLPPDELRRRLQALREQYYGDAPLQ